MGAPGHFFDQDAPGPDEPDKGAAERRSGGLPRELFDQDAEVASAEPRRVRIPRPQIPKAKEPTRQGAGSTRRGTSPPPTRSPASTPSRQPDPRSPAPSRKAVTPQLPSRPAPAPVRPRSPAPSGSGPAGPGGFPGEYGVAPQSSRPRPSPDDATPEAQPPAANPRPGRPQTRLDAARGALPPTSNPRPRPAQTPRGAGPAGRERPAGAQVGQRPAGSTAPPTSPPRRRQPRPSAGDQVPPPARSGSALGRATGVLAAGTFLSRLSGFLRVIVAAYIFGESGLSDAYNFANNVPNIIYDLLLGGILSATLIPVFVDELRRTNRKERERAISAILTVAGAVLVVLSVALYYFAPLIIRFYLLLNHTSTKGDEVAVATSLLRLFAPQVFFLGAIVVSTALLNARRQFAAGAFSGAANNVVGIAALVATDLVAPTLHIGAFRHDHRGLLILGLGTTLGYVAQLLVQLPAMARGGLLLRPVWAPRHPAVKRVVGLSSWLIGVVVANQVSFNLIAIIAGQKPGQYTAYQYAYQFFQLPYALLTVSIASAIMPDLAARWSAGDPYAFLARVINGVRVTLALMIPAAVGYALVATPVVDLAIRHFSFKAGNANLLAGALQMFALGLPGFSAFLPLVRALQAMKDTRAMFFIYAFENALSVILAFTLYGPLGDRGLALAFVAPYTVAAIVAAVYLHRKVGSLGGVYTARSIGRTAVATAGLAIVVAVADRVLPHGTTDVSLVVRLVVDVAAGAGVYLLLARWLGIDDLQPVLRLVRPVLVRLRLASAGGTSGPASVGS